MSKITGNEPAMPIFNSEGAVTLISNIVPCRTTPVASGLTIRQQFAMAAMDGLLSNPSMTDKITRADTMAEWAVANADALIAELNRTEADNV